MSLLFEGVSVAVTTPMLASGEVDFDSFREHLEFLKENKMQGFIINGTTGEGTTLTAEEYTRLFEIALDVANKELPVIAGTGSNNTQASIELTKEAEKIGVDGMMLVAPYYNRPSQEGLYLHFKAIAEATKLPIMIYNIPGRTACNIDVDTLVRLSQIENIVSVKEASGDLDAMAEIIERTPEHFTVYSGDDSLTLPVLSIGGNGVVSVASHIIGNEIQEMINQFNEGKVKEASAAHRKLLPTFKALFTAPNPIPVKAVLNMIGVNVGSVRLPLVPLTPEQEEMLKKQINIRITKAS